MPKNKKDLSREEFGRMYPKSLEMHDKETFKALVKGCAIALDYIGDNKGECEVCGGNGKDLDYSEHCPCSDIRRALNMAKVYPLAAI